MPITQIESLVIHAVGAGKPIEVNAWDDGDIVIWELNSDDSAVLKPDQIQPLIDFLQRHAPKVVNPYQSPEELLLDVAGEPVATHRHPGPCAIRLWVDGRNHTLIGEWGGQPPVWIHQEQLRPVIDYLTSVEAFLNAPEPADDGEDIVSLASALRETRKRRPGGPGDVRLTASLREKVLAGHALTGRTVERLMTSGNADDEALATLISNEFGAALDPARATVWGTSNG